MKRIVIDGEVLCTDRMDGIHRFMIEILSRIDKILPTRNGNSEEEIEIQLIHSKGQEIKNLSLQNIKVVELDCKSRGMRYSKVPSYVKSVDGIYCSMSNDSICYKNSIITIMDLIPLSPLAKYPLKSLLRMKLVYARMKKYGKKFVTISEASRNDISIKLGISRAFIDLVGTGHEHMASINVDESVFEKYSITKGNYFYAMGNQYPYKNFEWVRQVAKRNPESLFVIAGKVTNIDGSVDDSESNLKYIGYITDEEHKALLKNAKAFIHPSKLEGFGIPPLESLSLGTPVIIARASCLPEIYGNTAHYIDPDDYDVDLGKLMEEEVADPSELLQKYTWDNVAADWMKIFEEA